MHIAHAHTVLYPCLHTNVFVNIAGRANLFGVFEMGFRTLSKPKFSKCILDGFLALNWHIYCCVRAIEIAQYQE